MNRTPHPVIRSGFLLGLIALLGTALLAGVNGLTHERIIEQENFVSCNNSMRLFRSLHTIMICSGTG